jgi:hypothetical protein
VAAFDSEDFGAGQVLDELVGFSSDVVEAAFGQAVDGRECRRLSPTYSYEYS